MVQLLSSNINIDRPTSKRLKMASSKKAPELVVLQEFAGIIQEAIVEPLSLSSKLYSRDIIDRRVQMSVLEHGSSSYDKAMNLHKAIEAKIQAAASESERAEIFSIVLDTMDDQIPLDSVAERMRIRYKEIKSNPIESIKINNQCVHSLYSNIRAHTLTANNV